MAKKKYRNTHIYCYIPLYIYWNWKGSLDRINFTYESRRVEHPIFVRPNCLDIFQDPRWMSPIAVSSPRSEALAVIEKNDDDKDDDYDDCKIVTTFIDLSQKKVVDNK